MIKNIIYINITQILKILDYLNYLIIKSSDIKSFDYKLFDYTY